MSEGHSGACVAGHSLSDVSAVSDIACIAVQITAEEEYATLCTFLETLLTMLW